jgi:hypothetical protein
MPEDIRSSGLELRIRTVDHLVGSRILHLIRSNSLLEPELSHRNSTLHVVDFMTVMFGLRNRPGTLLFFLLIPCRKHFLLSQVAGML